MATLIFASDSNPNHSNPIKIDTKDVLAVVDLGFQDHSDKKSSVFAHRRAVYFKDGVTETGDAKVSMKTVWERSSGKAAPTATAALDHFGGKPFVTMAKVSHHGSSNAFDLATDLPVSFSTAEADVKELKIFDSHGTNLTDKVGFAAAFNKSGKAEKIPTKTTIYHTHLQLGADTPDAPAPRIAVAHLDQHRADPLRKFDRT